MRPCLFIGGPDDGSTHPAPDDAIGPRGAPVERCITAWRSAWAARLLWSTFTKASLTPTQALELLAGHYKACCVSQPGGRR